MIFWIWYLSTFVIGGLGLLIVLTIDIETITVFGLSLSDKWWSAIYTLMLVNSGWEIANKVK